MKEISPQLLSHISGTVVTIAHCWKIILVSGVTTGFTDYDRDLEICGILYHSTPSMSLRSTRHGENASIAQLESTIDSSLVTKEDILNGLYESATVELFLINYEDISQGIATLFKGAIEKIIIDNDCFRAQITGTTHALSNKFGKLFSPQCRAQFCDSLCKLAAEQFIFRGTVSKVVEERKIFEDNGLPYKNGYYKYSTVTFSGGKNHGISVDVQEHVGYSINLLRNLPFPISVNDTYSIIADVTQNFRTCKEKFNNAKNFRGEPHVPDLNTIYQPLD